MTCLISALFKMKSSSASKPRKSRKPRQAELAFRSWGGRRKGAGRKPGKGRRSLLHRTRSPFPKRKHGSVLHVTFRLVDEVANVRRWSVFAAFVELISHAHRSNF